MRRRRIRRPEKSTELSITAFMNLMVILVPFLLMTAVFSHMTILDLNLPNPDEAGSNSKKAAFDLKIIVRKSSLTVMDGRAVIKTIPLHKGQHNFKILSKVLMQVKTKYQNKQAITILSEPRIPYEILVGTMDAARSFFTFQEGSIIEAELFPEISIGDAPRK
ncbi:MAG: biopolymer transporter ExbD [Gammaproteobacteria bacterium]|nr:biopolymer transporter ExbD [Gammaproteobacteria bacterium]